MVYALNCELPEAVDAFVESENLDVALRALHDGVLRPISEMGHPRDSTRPGVNYVYFRVMLNGENAGNMAFGSVGSGMIAYKARMVFEPAVWGAGKKRGGYVSTLDRKGDVGNTPYNTQKQAAIFNDLTNLRPTTRGTAEVGVKGSVLMSHLREIWCLFPTTLRWLEGERSRKNSVQDSKLPVFRDSGWNRNFRERNRPVGRTCGVPTRIRRSPPVRHQRPSLVIPKDRDIALENYEKLIRFLPRVEDRGVIARTSTLRWLVFRN